MKRKADFCRYIVISLFLLIFFLCPVTGRASNMDSANYEIQFGNVNIGAKDLSSPSYNLGTTLGQTAAQSFSSAGYYVLAGFQYIHTIIPFRFSISDTSIALGTLVPGVGATAPTTLTVSFGAAGQYEVTAIEEGPLRTLSGGASIPDTTCDSSCTITSADPWTSSTKYGFGYNMTGQDIPADFTDGTYYRPFPDRTAAEDPAVVMTSTNVGKNRQSVMTFKANVDAIQAAGQYQTVINFVATPTY